MKDKKEKAEERKRMENELKDMEKEDYVKLKEEDDDDEDVFAKLKSNVDKRYESKSEKNKANENVVDKANKYIYMGKINEMFPFTTKRTDELSSENVKSEVSFSMFKRMGF